MRNVLTFAAFTLIGVASLSVRAADIDLLVSGALSADAKAADAAVAELRAGGPEALARLFEMRDRLTAAGDDKSQTDRLDALIDRVGGAKYCSASRLFWYTDLQAAQQVAAESGKPILSLRMMGNLTDELSCANSRFFRTSLYANAQISQYLRDNFVLHWKSVRPVPKVTIDFGDGRKLERTLTGNSIHYILAPNGQVIDALPGLYGPAAFQKLLREGESVAQAYAKADAARRAELLKWFHNDRIRDIGRRWEKDLAMIRPPIAASNSIGENRQGELRVSFDAPQRDGDSPRAEAPPPRADAAARVALPKADLEMPLIRAVASITALEKKTDDELWEKIAALHSAEAKLDAASVDLIRKQNPTAREAGRVAITKRLVEDPILKLVANFQSSIALDTVRNEYLLHRQIHQWLAAGQADRDVEKLNDRVYAELFLTPKTDPWIGLLPQDTYTAIENGGVVREVER